MDDKIYVLSYWKTKRKHIALERHPTHPRLTKTLIQFNGFSAFFCVVFRIMTIKTIRRDDIGLRKSIYVPYSSPSCKYNKIKNKKRKSF